MPKSNRICHTCNQGYYFCPTCPSKGKTESFYNMFCSERCSKIFKLLTDETFKHITIEECKEKLQELNVSKEEVFKENINKHINRVFSVKEKKSEKINFKEENNEDSISVVENIEVVKMTATPRRSRKKKNSEVD